jgi:fatty acid desaturase
VPAYSHTTHIYHHRLATFGTELDPEYELWSERPWWFLARPLVLSLLYPLFLILRFGLLPLIFGLLPLQSQRWIHKSLSTFVMNLKFERPYSLPDFQRMRREDLFCSVYFLALLATVFLASIPLQIFVIMYLQIILISWLNTYRALVAHRYSGVATKDEDPIQAMLSDSVVIEGCWYSELWAPNQLRFHSTHHLLPGIPYHNLKKAHEKLKQILPAEHPYRKTIEPSFLSAFTKLYRACRSKP